jgi:hypothetical protein
MCCETYHECDCKVHIIEETNEYIIEQFPDGQIFKQMKLFPDNKREG